ncbi:MAG: tRNA pseudouridine synthase A [Planctomycetaceae bacterium]
MRTILLTLAYDGSGYCGWQVQPNGNAVQSAVEQALLEYTGETIRVTAAGRTDAGVHALEQLASFSTMGEIPAIGFRRGLQTKLPQDLVVRDAVEVPLGFSARYDTVRKTYRYVIQNEPLRTPWLRNYVGWHRTPLNVNAMQAALDVLVGTHDFRSFESEWPNKATSVRTIHQARVWRTEGWDGWRRDAEQGCERIGEGESKSDGPDKEFLCQGDSMPGRNDNLSIPGGAPESVLDVPPFVCIDITADGFLYNMMRAIVGTLIHVGRGTWTSADMRRILKSQNRAEAGETAPAQGLYLLRCEYEIDHQRIAQRLARPASLETAESGEPVRPSE